MRLALMTTLLWALAACGGQKEPTGPEQSAAGEVLGGEITDAMLPLDTVRSTSPADPRSSASGTPRAATPPADGGEVPPSPETSGDPSPDTDVPTEQPTPATKPTE